MQRSESIKALAKALVLAKSKMESPTKNKTNPHFKSSYADLAAVKSSYQTALGDAGLSVVSALALKDAVLTLTTTVVHAESAEFIASDFPIPSGLKAQDIGSAVSYGRRYNVCSLLDIVAEDDDDGNAAQGATPKAAEKPKAAPEPKPPVLSQDERVKISALAKSRGILTAQAFSEFLGKHCPEARTASELSRSEYVAVTDALNAMPLVSTKASAA